MKNRIYDNSSIKKLYKAKGIIINGSFFKSHQPFSGLIMVCSTTTAIDTFEKKMKSPIESVLIEDNGNIHFNARYEILSWVIADDNGYNDFLSFLDKKNFKFVLETSERVFGLGNNKCLETHIKWVIKYKDPNKVNFICQNQILDRKGIEDMELSNDKAILAYYDNGYSYTSADPIAKEKFLEIADEIISLPFKWSHKNIQVVEHNNNFYIRCMIGQNKHWSEQSNS